MTDETDTNLCFEEFERPTYAKWRREAEQSLKGASFEKKLITQTYEQIALKPIYNPEDLENISIDNELPGFSPYIRGTSALVHSRNGWGICQESPYSSAKRANETLKEDLARGLFAISISLDRAGKRGEDPGTAPAEMVGSGGVSIANRTDIEEMLAGIDTEKYPLHLYAGCSVIPLASLLFAHFRSKGDDMSRLHGSITADPLGELTTFGGLPRPLAQLYDEIAAFTAWILDTDCDLRTLLVNGSPYHDAGASAVEELAFSLATGVTYLREMISRGIGIDDVANRIRFTFCIGPFFFMEVAKLRAARMVWAQAVSAFGGSFGQARINMHVRTSRWHQTVCDPYVNILRGATETFSAVVGGADTIHTSPFDEAICEPDEFSRRVALHTQNVLLDESRAHRVIDPAGGSWYVESLTHEIAQRAWALFREIEGKGGMAAALAEGFPQKMVKSTARKRAADLETRRTVLVGTNMYANVKEEPLFRKGETPQGDFALARAKKLEKTKKSGDGKKRAGLLDTIGEALKKGGKHLVEQAIEVAVHGATIGEINDALTRDSSAKPEVVDRLQIHRGAERYEKLRFALLEYAKRTGSRPKVFLANMGSVAQHKARADFATGFFEVAGFDVDTNKGFSSAQEAGEAAVSSGARIAVICSTDDTYPELVPAFIESVRNAEPPMMTILAGYPKEQIQQHKATGVDEFIHLKSNNYEILVRCLKYLGVEL